ncbi:MAG TPA: heat-inducible transcriptional repressor HrcA [Polyangia bacterium]|nr:heat-inducible transcriptional repressor HrcA [Polyangia bacterium]
MPDINHRARKILQAVVQEFIATGDAVGSRTITKRYGLELSPATVRNVMADLEETGLLTQPHTSAGRVPTDAGLRYFVDTLLKVRSLSAKEKEEIAARYQVTALEFDDLMKETSKLLSELSQHTALVFAPRADSNVFEHIEFMRLRESELLAVLVTKAGKVVNKIIPLDKPLSDPELDRIHNYLNSLLEGLTLEEVRAKVVEEIGRTKNQYDQLVARALALGAQALEGVGRPDVIIEGQANLLDKQHDPEKLRTLLKALEEKQQMLALLDRTLEAPGIQVFIGAETNLAPLRDMSVVAASYGPEDRPLGTLGVIGPQRMNYSRVISLVDFTAHLLSDVLNRM